MNTLILIKATENHFEAVKEKRIADILNYYANSEYQTFSFRAQSFEISRVRLENR